MAEKSPEDDSPLPPSQGKRRKADALEYVQSALHGLRFGEITLIIHDGVVVQIDRTEKRRLNGLGQ